MFRRRNIFEDPIRHRRWVHGPSGKNLMLRVPMGKDINTYIPRELRENRFPMGLLNPRGAPVHYWGVNKWGPPGSGEYRKEYSPEHKDQVRDLEGIVDMVAEAVVVFF